ncbi:CDP-alcohol phosphatidyltransferase family protein [Micrococcus luteus]|uniref:CDP-alcohol phosphatidyltransferase family protein n=1 Tax=Micrococcus luteus TaxID=1270 RepID=UPI000BF683C1|nr:CDP-alcohol phosphatidyltransferase family protein [Micrococcus luteus]PFH06942.1 CDP-diacylglycerol--glycerol-3-phosphate 3-phosphatidyltransferase [Micrococcaceae bacterium JKS001869]MCC0765897.1 CDP-alcohol phosphatidyltransferase family protein [Micrococcus luteus]MCV7451624.1 CDP-alcohol phosphatidyltransferase family protein [Micrococcus luteus]MCV7512533.1 CDP-alcohol phosphatidyltransferase family protein [Micrococcus luteus]MCV7521099.1 CDP-alcohol phosphatidyltransferase family pr
MSAAGGAQRVSAWNLPNILTSVRILMVPFFAWALWVGGPWGGDSLVARWLALALFAAAMYTDKLDGDIARARGLITDFGKIADPIADKLLTGTALVLFSLLGELWWWVTIVILVREWGITLMRFVVIRYGVMPAGRGGKLKTVLQTVGIGLLLLPLVPLVGGWWPWAGWVVIGAATVLTVLTGLEYVKDAWVLRRDALAAQRGA